MHDAGRFHVSRKNLSGRRSFGASQHEWLGHAGTYAVGACLSKVSADGGDGMWLLQESLGSKLRRFKIRRGFVLENAWATNFEG